MESLPLASAAEVGERSSHVSGAGGHAAARTCPLRLQTPLAPALLPLHAGMYVPHVMWRRKVRPAFSEFPNRSLI